MSDQFLAEIRIVGFNFAPLGWALCNGQLLPISQNTALFSLLGTNFGGNGTSNFGLPNLQGSVPIHWNQGPGLSDYDIGQSGGEQTVTLSSSQMAAHTHGAQFSTAAGSLPSPANNVWAKPPGGGHGQPAAEQAYSTVAQPPPYAVMGAAVSSIGGNEPHNNMSPYLVMNFVIALTGIYPTRS